MDEGLSEKEALEKMLTLTDEERTEMVEGSMGGTRQEKEEEVIQFSNCPLGGLRTSFFCIIGPYATKQWQFRHEIKSQLAKLLATEDLVVEHKKLKLLVSMFTLVC